MALTFTGRRGPTVRVDGAGTDTSTPNVAAYGTTAEWTASGHVLDVGELGLDTTTGDLKAGNGSSLFSALSSVNSGTYAQIAGTSPVSVTTTSESASGLNIVHTGTATQPLRLEQVGSGPVAKWRSGGVDRGFVQNDGGLRLLPASGGRAVVADNPTWAADRSYGYSNKDFLFGVTGFTDYSGVPTLSGSQQSYSKLFGATATKYGVGNMDAFWASIQGNGPDEIGLFIGDTTSHTGGNAWGLDVRAQNDTTDSTLIGALIGVQRNAAPGAGSATTLAADSAVGDQTAQFAANPGTGRFTLGSGASLESLSILSVTGAGPYTAALANTLSYAHTSGAALTPVTTAHRGLHVRSFGAYPASIGMLMDTDPTATGGWTDYLRIYDTNGSTLLTQVLGISADTASIASLRGQVVTTRVRIDTTGMSPSQAAALQINAIAGQTRDLQWQTSGLGRWIMRVDATSESGGNAGSNLALPQAGRAGRTTGRVLRACRGRRRRPPARSGRSCNRPAGCRETRRWRQTPRDCQSAWPECFFGVSHGLLLSFGLLLWPGLATWF